MQAVVAALRVPGALDRRGPSPAGFEWSAAEAAAGTAMDQLIRGEIDGPRVCYCIEPGALRRLRALIGGL